MDKVEQYLQASFQPYLTYQPSEGAILNGHFNRFVSINLKGNDFEVPAAYAIVAIMVKNAGYDKLVLPLYTNQTSLYRASLAGNILNQFRQTEFGARLCGVITSKGEIYYGARGLILDKDKMPLSVATLKLHCDAGQYYVNGAAWRIPYSVFERQEEVMPKLIYKKIIPALATTPVGDINWGEEPIIREFSKADIEIGMGADIVLCSNIPKPSSVSEEEFTRIVRANLDTF